MPKPHWTKRSLAIAPTVWMWVGALTFLGATRIIGGCHPQVVRDATTYRAEITFHRDFELAAAPELLELAGIHRERGNLPACVRVARIALIASARARWHAGAALALAGLETPDGGIGREPDIPPTDTFRQNGSETSSRTGGPP